MLSIERIVLEDLKDADYDENTVAFDVSEASKTINVSSYAAHQCA